MKTGRLLGWLCLVGLLVTARDVGAKGPPAKAVLSGPGLQGEVAITDAQALAPLALGVLEDFTGGAIQAPGERATDANRYTLVSYFDDGNGSYRPFDRLYYYPDPSGGRGYILYEGLRISGGWSEYDGKWFNATPEGDQSMRRLLERLGVTLTVAPTLPATGRGSVGVAWLLALAGVFALGGGLLRWRRWRAG